MVRAPPRRPSASNDPARRDKVLGSASNRRVRWTSWFRVLTCAAVLENAKASAGGHRLGVNGLAVDSDNAIL